MRNWLTQLGRLRSLLISCRQAADPGKSVVPLSSSLNMRTRDANDINRSPDWKSWDSWDVSAESARHAKRGQFILPLPFVLFRHWTHKIRPTYIVILFLLFIYLAVQVLVVACGALIFTETCRMFSCGMWDLVPWPGIKPAPPALGVQSLNHWTTREVPKAHPHWEV